MNRALALAAVLCGISAALPSPVSAQNLEAGKSPGQLFTNTCTACHRSPRGLLRTVPPGSLPSFLREHYTTSRDMAQQLSGFLISNGATDTRGRPQEVRQQPAVAEQPRSQQPPAGAAEQPRPQRPVEQDQATRPPQAQPPQLSPAEEARQARQERRAKREAERAARSAAEREAARKDGTRRNRITPARIQAASERGKDALPLGSVVKVEPPADVAKPEAVIAPSVESGRPSSAVAPQDTSMRSDPVPPVTPAPPAAETPTGSSNPDGPRGSDDTSPAVPAPAADSPAPASSGAPPAPPISN
jgi:hypothetical protein